MLDKGCPILTAELEQMLKINQKRFNLTYVKNTGPYRKIIPVLNEVYEYHPSDFYKTLIVTADDDTAYPPYWLQRLYDSYRLHRCVIGFRGRSIKLENNLLTSYKKWERQIGDNTSLFSVPTGKDGVLYSPISLNPDVLNIAAAQQLAPKADDLWLKMHTLLGANPSYIINSTLNQEFPSVTGKEPEVSLYRSFNERGGNDEALNNLEGYLTKRYGTSFYALLHPRPQLQQQRAIAQLKGLIDVE